MAFDSRCVFLLIAFVLMIAAGSLHGKDQDVLLIGNSYTIYTKNAFENVVAGSSGHSLYLEMIAVGGSTLSGHYSLRSTQIRTALQSRAWDAVVIQEHSLGPINNPSGFLQGATDLSVMIKQERPNARIWLYETWARRAGHAIYTGGYTPAQMQKELRDQYDAVAAAIGASVIPVGDVFEEAYNRLPYPQLDLHVADGSHQNDAGKYLCGLSLYSVLFDTSPSNTSYTGGVSGSELALFRESITSVIPANVAVNDGADKGGGSCSASGNDVLWPPLLVLSFLIVVALVRRKGTVSI